MRRTLRLLVLAAGGSAVVVTAVFLAGLYRVHEDGAVGAARARAGMVALRAGDAEAAGAAFADAAAAFGRADAVADAWWMAPAGALPVVSDHLAATQALTEAGRSLAEASAAAAPAVATGDLAGPGGRIRVDRVAEMAPLARSVVAALEGSEASLASVSGAWLAPPVEDAVTDLRIEVAEALPGARLAADVLRVAPELLGHEGSRTYAVLFANPAEARALGGFVASIGILTADDGRLGFEALDEPAVLEEVLAAAGTAPDEDLPAAFTASGQPHRFVRNWTDAADIDTVATATRAYLPAAIDRPVHGVVYADPHVVAALLELAGPVTVEGSGDTLTASSAVEFLLRDQYLAASFEPGAARKERLGAAGSEAFARLVRGVPPDLSQLGALLGPLIEGRRLQFATGDPVVDEVLGHLGLRPQSRGAHDITFLVAHGNRRANKLDAYLDRRLRYEIHVDADGAVRATARITLVNRAPTRGLDDYQRSPALPGHATPRETAVVRLDVVTSLAATAARIGSRSAPMHATASDGSRHLQIPVEVPAGGRAVVEVDLTGRVDPHACRVVFEPNGGAGVDRLEASLHTPSGLTTVAGRLIRSTEMICR